MYLPKSAPKYTVLNVTDFQSMDFKSLLLQVQFLGWLDKVYLIELPMFFPTKGSLSSALRVLSHAMILTKSLTYTLLCSPCPILRYLESFWTNICFNDKIYKAELAASTPIFLSHFFTNAVSTFYNGAFFSICFANDFLKSEIDDDHVYDETLNFLQQRSSIQVLESNEGQITKHARILLSFAYWYKKKHNKELDIDALFSYCQTENKWNIDLWIEAFTDECLKKLVAQVRQITEKTPSSY